MVCVRVRGGPRGGAYLIKTLFKLLPPGGGGGLIGCGVLESYFAIKG